MKHIITILFAITFIAPSFADGDNPKSGAANRTSSNGINWKKFHKKQHKAMRKRHRNCNIWLTL